MDISKILDAKGSTKVFSVPSDTTLSQLISEMCRLHVGAMLIAGPSGALTGIVSERDILALCNRKTDFEKVTAGEIMTKDLVTVTPEDDINLAMDLMIGKKVRHLPVLSKGKIAGLITVRDLLLAMRKADQEELRMLVEYLEKSAATAVPA